MFALVNGEGTVIFAPLRLDKYKPSPLLEYRFEQADKANEARIIQLNFLKTFPI